MPRRRLQKNFPRCQHEGSDDLPNGRGHDLEPKKSGNGGLWPDPKSLEQWLYRIDSREHFRHSVLAGQDDCQIEPRKRLLVETVCCSIGFAHTAEQLLGRFIQAQCFVDVSHQPKTMRLHEGFMSKFVEERFCRGIDCPCVTWPPLINQVPCQCMGNRDSEVRVEVRLNPIHRFLCESHGSDWIPILSGDHGFDNKAARKPVFVASRLVKLSSPRQTVLSPIKAPPIAKQRAA